MAQFSSKRGVYRGRRNTIDGTLKAHSGPDSVRTSDLHLSLLSQASPHSPQMQDCKTLPLALKIPASSIPSAMQSTSNSSKTPTSPAEQNLPCRSCMGAERAWLAVNMHYLNMLKLLPTCHLRLLHGTNVSEEERPENLVYVFVFHYCSS
jgi:hypothetical protein